MKQPPTIEEQHNIAEEIVGTPIEWEEDHKGYFLCPMHEGHTTPTKDKHTICYLDEVHTFFCWHQSCKEWMELASSELREKLDFRTPEQKAADKEKSKLKVALQCEAREMKWKFEEPLYKEFAWPELLVNPLSSRASWDVFLNLWNLTDYLWVGDVWDTGDKKQKHFARQLEWRLTNTDFYHNRFTTGSTFKPDSHDRTLTNVLEHKYTVIEFDWLDQDPEINKQKAAAIFNYCRLQAGYPLRMVVDSGNKSIHGWFENTGKMNEDARYFLRHLGADTNTMRPSQPVRLPGGRRENGRIRRVLYVSD